MRYRRNRQIAGDLHQGLFASPQRQGRLSAEEQIYVEEHKKVERFGCVQCGLRCASCGREGAHFFKRHAVTAAVRYLCDGTQCPHSLRAYHTSAKLQQHVQRSAVCRGMLRARRMWTTPSAGIGSTDQSQDHRAHDGLVPTLQALGPSIPERPPAETVAEHCDLMERWLGILEQKDYDGSIQDAFAAAIRETPISWTQCKLTR